MRGSAVLEVVVSFKHVLVFCGSVCGSESLYLHRVAYLEHVYLYVNIVLYCTVLYGTVSYVLSCTVCTVLHCAPAVFTSVFARASALVFHCICRMFCLHLLLCCILYIYVNPKVNNTFKPSSRIRQGAAPLLGKSVPADNATSAHSELGAPKARQKLSILHPSVRVVSGWFLVGNGGMR